MKQKIENTMVRRTRFRDDLVDRANCINSTFNNIDLDRWAKEAHNRHMTYGALQAMETCGKVDDSQVEGKGYHKYLGLVSRSIMFDTNRGKIDLPDDIRLAVIDDLRSGMTIAAVSDKHCVDDYKVKMIRRQLHKEGLV